MSLDFKYDLFISIWISVNVKPKVLAEWLRFELFPSMAICRLNLTRQMRFVAHIVTGGNFLLANKYFISQFDFQISSV